MIKVDPVNSAATAQFKVEAHIDARIRQQLLNRVVVYYVDVVLV